MGSGVSWLMVSRMVCDMALSTHTNIMNLYEALCRESAGKNMNNKPITITYKKIKKLELNDKFEGMEMELSSKSFWFKTG
jgi:hypothetical protein